MKLRFSKRDKWLLTAALILLALGVFYAQFQWLAPLKSDLAIKQQLLNTNQRLLDKAEQKKASAPAPAALTAENTSSLQEKVPVKPLEDQLIIDLEQAESLSNSQIKSMSFTKDVQVTAATNAAVQSSKQPGAAGAQPSPAASGQPQTAAQPPAAQSSQNQGNAGTSTTAAANPAPPAAAGITAAASGQSGLKKLTVQLSVESPSYEEFEKFVGAIEALPRIVAVENISYSGGQEVTSLTQDNKPLTYSLTISTFYMAGLADLQPGLPKMDTPAPANKDNPLSTVSSAAP